MAGVDGANGSPRDPDGRLLARLRLIAIAVILVLVALLAVVDTLGRLLVSPDFHIGDVVFTALLGTLVTLFGFEGIARLTGGK